VQAAVVQNKKTPNVMSRTTRAVSDLVRRMLMDTSQNKQAAWCYLWLMARLFCPQPLSPIGKNCPLLYHVTSETNVCVRDGSRIASKESRRAACGGFGGETTALIQPEVV
jgi:hypothetical protein